MRANISVGRTLAALVALALASPAGATVTEPDKRTVPIMTGEGVNLELGTLFTSRGEAINWLTDALTTPAVFSPLCSFTGTLVLRGAGCKLDFGWYNVVPGVDGGAPAPPSDAEIYTLVPHTDPINQRDFHPQVGEMGTTFTADAIRSNPNYKGGLIGFALRGDPGQECKQTHFSQPELNVTCTACAPPGPWVTAVIYKSTVTPNAYYVAFEDLPVDATRFDPGPADDKNDGDFNDFVYFITGLTCDGGGKPCDTGKPGVCAEGVTDCSPAGQPNVCRQKVDPSPEKCDNIDNDCNGKVDDGDLCEQGYICLHGTCVAACRGEFGCTSDLVCDNGFCVDPLCVGKMCKQDEVCRAGKCIDPCTGVACPKGQACQKGVGKCVDVCAGIKCEHGDVCEDGACVAPCACRTCPAGKSCSAAGPCVDTGCEAKTCAAGEVCELGNCVDACQGATCPGGAACAAGQCGEPPEGGAGGGDAETDSNFVGGGGLIVGPGTPPGTGGASGAGDAPDASVGVATGGSDTTRRAGATSSSGCSCEVVGRGKGNAPLLLLGLSLVIAKSRRRRGAPRA
jgi:hypothetical protein